MNKTKEFILIILIAFSNNVFSQENNPEKTITVSSYLLRDRAIILDSLVMKKRMYVSFKTSLPLSVIKRGSAVGTLSHKEEIIAYDTTYFFDETSGNLGFSLPYNIPEGKYHLDIKIYH